MTISFQIGKEMSPPGRVPGATLDDVEKEDRKGARSANTKFIDKIESFKIGDVVAIRKDNRFF